FARSHDLPLNLSAPLRYLHPFPTRRSSDLLAAVADENGVRLRPAGQEIVGAAGAAVLGQGFHFPAAGVADGLGAGIVRPHQPEQDRKSTRLNSSHVSISYAVFCLKKKKAAV